MKLRSMPSRFLLLVFATGIPLMAQGRAAPSDPPAKTEKAQPKSGAFFSAHAPDMKSGDSIKLPYGRLLGLNTRSQCRVECVPDDAAIEIDYKEGPKDVYALWQGPIDDYQWKSLGAEELKFIIIVRAKKEASGRITILLVPETNTKDTPLTRFTLDLGGIPPPIPTPVDPVVPDASGPMRVMILFESATSLPGEQHTAIYSEETRNYLESHCAKLPNGKADYCIWDKDVKGVEKESAIRQDLFNAAKDKSMPWIIAMKGTKRISQAVPANKAEMLKLLKSVGGA